MELSNREEKHKMRKSLSLEELSEELRQTLLHDDLDEQMRVKVYFEAISNAETKIRTVQYNRKISEPIVFEPRKKDQVIKNFYDNFKSENGIEFDLTEHNQDIVAQLALYFSDDDRFEGDLNKGILIQGPTGSGKTSVMRAFGRSGNRSFGVKTTKEIVSEYCDSKNGGMGAVEKYTLERIDYFKRPNGTLFDDFGSEPNGKHYGNEVNVMEDILERIESKRTWRVMHLTSNISLADIKIRYGDRIYSRIKQMFNVISYDVNAKDMRK